MRRRDRARGRTPRLCRSDAPCGGARSPAACVWRSSVFGRGALGSSWTHAGCRTRESSTSSRSATCSSISIRTRSRCPKYSRAGSPGRGFADHSPSRAISLECSGHLCAAPKAVPTPGDRCQGPGSRLRDQTWHRGLCPRSLPLMMISRLGQRSVRVSVRSSARVRASRARLLQSFAEAAAAERGRPPPSIGG